MTTLKTIGFLGKIVATLTLCMSANLTIAGQLTPLLDDFSDNKNNNLGIPRQFLDDKMAGGQTQTNIEIADGKLNIKGEIIPPRGQPGWASSVLLLNAEGTAEDASDFDGIRILLKVNNGNISISANSSEITNFDYHASVVAVQADGKFHEVKIPFAGMKRTWSEQTPLNTALLTSLSIVSFGLQRTPFEFEIDEVGFY